MSKSDNTPNEVFLIVVVDTCCNFCIIARKKIVTSPQNCCHFKSLTIMIKAPHLYPIFKISGCEITIT